MVLLRQRLKIKIDKSLAPEKPGAKFVWVQNNNEEMQMRKRVNRKFLRKVKYGPMYILRITYVDGRKSWAVSVPGMIALFGSDRKAANDYIRAAE